MENPRFVGRLFIGVLVFALAMTVVVSICTRDFSVFAWGLAVVAFVLIGAAAVSAVWVVVFGPLLWLLSRLLGGGRRGPGGG
jgi:hypothetical protein